MIKNVFANKETSAYVAAAIAVVAVASFSYGYRNQRNKIILVTPAQPPVK